MDTADVIKDTSLALFNSNSKKHHFSDFSATLPEPGQIVYGTRPAQRDCEDIFSPLTQTEEMVEFGDEIECSSINHPEPIQSILP